MLMRRRRDSRAEPGSRDNQAAVAASNRRVFERPDVVEEHIRDTTLRAAERTILDRYRADYVGKRVLDLGVGGGRTAPALAPSAARYVGIDFSTRMAAHCQRRFPEWDFRWGDARDLSMFGAESFDFVLFSYNGLDYVGDEDRKRVLGEVLRVLSKGGSFTFSSHNLDAFTDATWRWRVVLRPRPPAELARAVRGAGRSVRNRLHNARKQIRTDRYAILNDRAYHFGALTYYIGAAAQIDQLREAGFTGPVEVLGDDGLPLVLCGEGVPALCRSEEAVIACKGGIAACQAPIAPGDRAASGPHDFPPSRGSASSRATMPSSPGLAAGYRASTNGSWPGMMASGRLASRRIVA